MATRRYDPLGFPVPIDFDGETAPRRVESDRRPVRGGRGLKRLVILGLLGFGVLPSIVGPAVMPDIRHGVVAFSLWRAESLEVGEDAASAAAELDRALAWHGDDPTLLCMRGMLHLAARDPAAAIADASRARDLSPTATDPPRLRALAHVCAGNADAALEDARLVTTLAGENDPQALNFRAYVRALVDREIPEALRDIDRAIEIAGDRPAEMLDTRGFLLHLAGRHPEALDDLDQAIDGMRLARRQLVLRAGRLDRTAFAKQLRGTDHALAVMLHHRGLVHEALGRKQESREDFELARKKGFDPTRGIF